MLTLLSWMMNVAVDVDSRKLNDECRCWSWLIDVVWWISLLMSTYWSFRWLTKVKWWMSLLLLNYWSWMMNVAVDVDSLKLNDEFCCWCWLTDVEWWISLLMSTYWSFCWLTEIKWWMSLLLLTHRSWMMNVAVDVDSLMLNDECRCLCWLTEDEWWISLLMLTHWS